MRHKLRALLVITSLLLIAVTPLLPTSSASAATVRGGGGSTTPSAQLQSDLDYITGSCSGLVNNSGTKYNNCLNYQSALAAVAQCSTPLFNKGNIPIRDASQYNLIPNKTNDSSCQTNINNLYGVYQTANGLLSSFLSNCKNLTSKNSQWNTCQNNYQYPLNRGLGCTVKMNDTTTTAPRGATSNDWNAVDPGNNCQGIISAILYQAAQNDCQKSNYTGADLAGCIQGYQGQAQGNSNACNGLSGSAATACQQGSNDVSSASNNTGSQGGSQASNASGPTCEADGDPLDWILCPIFNGVANLSHWIFSNIVQPWLVTTPISTNSSDPMYIAWSNFRIYGDIFLVIALLVIVFGQSIGGGLIDAYTAKKVLPRLLAAAVLINISIYLVAAMVDISNVIGGSIGALITAPLKGGGAFVIHPSGIAAGKIIGLSLTTGTLAFGAGLIGALMHGGSIAGIVGWLALFVILPMALGVLVTFVTLVVRKGLIIALVLVSPIAFALYCLPNTEQVFRRWWRLLLEMLMIYPIVVMIFAIADVLSVTTVSGNGSGSAIASIVSFVLQFLPLMFVPLAFRLAGGTLARAHEFMTTGHKRLQEGIKGNPNDPWSLQNRTRRRASNAMLMEREGMINSANKRQNAGGRYGVTARLANGMFSNDVLRSRKNKESAEMREGLTGAGDDWRYRAAFAQKMKYKRAIKDANGTTTGYEDAEGYFGIGARKDENGYRIDGTGTQFSSQQVRNSEAFVSQDPSHYQAGLTYEFTKAGGDDANENDLDVLMDSHIKNMERMRVKQEEMGAWTGSVFSNQNILKSFKHTKPSDSTVTADDGSAQRVYQRDSFTHNRETAETVSSWGLSNMRTREIRDLIANTQNARDHVVLKMGRVAEPGKDPSQWRAATQQDIDTANLSQANLLQRAKQTRVAIKPLRDNEQALAVIDYARSTADSLNSRLAAGGSFALQGEGSDSVPLSGAQTGAPGKVNEAIQDFVKVAGTPLPPPPPPRTRGPRR